MSPYLIAAQGALTLWQGLLTQQQWEKYNATVEQQIAEGKEISQARIDVAMQMIGNNPTSPEARAVVQSVNQAKADWGARRGEFLDTYDKRMQGVTGLLDQYGEQAITDIGREFGEAKGKALGDLSERGLSGGGVASSIGMGFATREADAIARAREQQALVRSGQAYNIESGRAAYDAAMSGAALDAGEAARQFGIGSYLGTSGDYLATSQGVQNMPPDTSGFNNAISQFGYGWGRGS